MIEQTNLLAKRLIPSVMELYQHAISSERQYEDQLARVDPVHQYSARNLIHYLAVRRSDIRQLQNDLAYLGLTSLGGMESFTLFALERGTAGVACTCWRALGARRYLGRTPRQLPHRADVSTRSHVPIVWCSSGQTLRPNHGDHAQ